MWWSVPRRRRSDQRLAGQRMGRLAGRRGPQGARPGRRGHPAAGFYRCKICGGRYRGVDDLISDSPGSVWDVSLAGEVCKVRDPDGAVTLPRASTDGKYVVVGTEASTI